MSEKSDLVVSFADGVRSSVEIAKLVGLSSRYVRRIMQTNNLPRLRTGARRGANNHQFVAGRRIELNGYALITPPEGHPTAKPRSGRIAGYMLEHRYVMEQKLGRLMLATERTDHVDGLTLHNHPDNLRLFANNAEHLKATLTSKVPCWSEAGYQNMKLKYHHPADFQRVDIHYQRRAAGAVRLRQILLTALRLGIGTPYLLGTTRHTTKAQIDMTSRPTIQRALDDLCQLWGWPPCS